MPKSALHRYRFETGVYRPPSEGSTSLLIRFSRNCPWNRCAFCSMYKTEKFELRTLDEIKQDIDSMAILCSDLKNISRAPGHGGNITWQAVETLVNRHPELNFHQGFAMVYQWLQAGAHTAFLQDANSLIMKTDPLATALRYLRKTFPSITRVTSYARSRTLAQKSLEALTAIRKAGLDRLHVGLETGDDALLKRIKKGVTAEGHIKSGHKAMEAGFQLSEYWMPGLGGKAMTQNHAINTARVLSKINPHYIRSRPFHPAMGTPLQEDVAKKKLQLLSTMEQMLELKQMVTTLDVTSKVCFDHAGNNWRDRRGNLLFTHRYEGYQFPTEKQAVLDLIEEGLRAAS
ncbi:MAG: radical SAM protein [Deltaproteobacteria bacterium]|nr:radical SAM protein [Deltaproteobacteria bacterium]